MERSRLLGSPGWSNVSRTYDHARVYYRRARARLEFLLVSPVKVRPDEFNHPVLENRVWGFTNSFPGLCNSELLEDYVLRHDQNQPGGFSGGSRAEGTDSLATQTFGFRLAGLLTEVTKFSRDGVLQNGRTGSASQRAGAWVSGATGRWKLAARPFDVSAEYGFASGSENASDPSHSGTSDPLYPSNHDRYGHADLLGWRNLHNVRSVVALRVAKGLLVSLMYDSFWLAGAREDLYTL